MVMLCIFLNELPQLLLLQIAIIGDKNNRCYGGLSLQTALATKHQILLLIIFIILCTIFNYQIPYKPLYCQFQKMLDCNHGQVLNLILQHPQQDQKFIVNEKTLNHIKQFQSHYCFVSICGDYRSGKSFLLNSLFFNYSGFQTSATTTSCTKGIKIWSQPIRYNDTCIWIIDTEGFGSIEKDSSYDGKIFLMNFLISNIILYNSFGAIDENSINKLAMICREARSLDESTIQSKLFWILRDFSLEMTDKNGKPLSSDQYLEECLKESHHQNKSQKQFLRTLFKQRHCFALIRPLIDQSKLNNLKQLSRIELREQFKSEISKLYDNIIEAVQCKMINGIRIGSHNIDILINDFVSTVNNGTIDCNLNCTYEKIMQHEHNMKKEAILSNLSNKIESLRKMLPVQKHHINYLRSQVTENVMQIFKQFQTHSKGAQLQLLKIQTNHEINTAIAALQKQNKQKLQQEIKEYLHRQLIELYPKLIALTLQGFQLKFYQTFSQLKEHYHAKYSQYLVQQSFLQQNYNQFIEKQEKKVFFQIVKRWRNSGKELEEKSEQLRKSKKLLEEETKKLKEEKAKMAKMLQQSKKQQAKALERMQDEVQQTFKEQTRLIVTNYQTKLKQLTSHHDEQIIQQKLTITNLQSQLSQLSTQHQYEKQSLLQKISLEKERAELASIKWQQTKNNIEIQQQQRKNTFQNKLKIAEIKYNQLQTNLNNERKKYQIISEERKAEENSLLQELADKNHKIDSLTEQLIHLEDRYKQELQRILIEEKDIVCKTVTSKINQYEYKCRVYEAKLQQYAINASEKEFYEQRSEELDIDNRQLKSLLQEEQDRNALLINQINKHEKELQEKQRIISNLKDQHFKQMSLLNQNLLNNQHFVKESELRHTQEIEWYKCKLQSALKDQSSDLSNKYQESLQNCKAILEQKFDKQRWQLKQIIKNNYDEVQNLKISIITLNSEMQKIYQILTRVLNDYQHFHKAEGESRRTSLRNSSHLSDIAESPEQEYSEKLPSALKYQRISKSTQFIAQEIEEIFVSLKEEIVLLTKERISMKQQLKSNMDEFDSFERVVGKVKQQNKNYRAELQQLRKRIPLLQSAARELQVTKQKWESLEKENGQLKRELDLKEQLFQSKDQNFKQNTIMYKQAITNLTEETKILSSKLRQLTQINEDCQSQLERFKIWATEVKNKPTYPAQQVEMSAEKMKDLQNEIKRLAKKLQQSKMQKLQKGAKRQVNLYSSILHQNRVSQIQALRAQNQNLYRQLQQKQDLQVKNLEQKKQSKQRQIEHQQSRYATLKEQYQSYKKKSKENISSLQSKIQIYKEQTKQLKQEYRELQATILQKYQFTKKVMEQQNEELKRQKQSLAEYYNKKLHTLQENLNGKTYEADKRIAEADLRFEQYRDELQKQHNRIILQGERHRLKYEHLLKVNGELIKEIQLLKSKAHQITIKQKYKSKISSLFDD